MSPKFFIRTAEARPDASTDAGAELAELERLLIQTSSAIDGRRHSEEDQ